MLALKIILIIIMLTVLYQDFKDRLVYWWLFPAIGILLGILHSNEVGFYQFLLNIGLTCSMTAVLLSTILIYYKIRFKTYNLTQAFGLGDILILFAFAIGFSPLSFITLLVFGLIFSLFLHWLIMLVFYENQSQNTKADIPPKAYNYESSVPLAGYLGLYFVMVLLIDWCGNNLYLYQI